MAGYGSPRVGTPGGAHGRPGYGDGNAQLPQSFGAGPPGAYYGAQGQYFADTQAPASTFHAPGPEMYPGPQGGDYGQHPNHSNAYMPPPGYGQRQGPASTDQFAVPGLNAPGLSPLHMLSAGSNFLSGSQTWGSQYVQRMQQRMGWLSGGALNHQFAISNQYVRSKLLMLLLPFLKSWTFARQQEQIQGVQKYRPPRVDVNAPDLYIPLVSAWSYVTLLCLNSLLVGRYRPDVVYSKVWWTGVAWAAHAGGVWLLLRMMSLPTSLPWGELFAYAGYVFVPACWTVALGTLAGGLAWWCGWAYGALCSAIFLVRTIKRVLFQEARGHYGVNLTLTNYLLLALAAGQFPLLLWLGHVQVPHHAGAAGLAAANGAAGAVQHAVATTGLVPGAAAAG